MNIDEITNVCLNEARISYEQGDVPIGAVIVCNGKVVAQAHNTREKEHNILGHAEINAILLASSKLCRWNLADCELYVTLKPCSMCFEVIRQARISKVFYLLDKLDFKKEYSKTEFVKLDMNSNELLYRELLSSFFKQKR